MVNDVAGARTTATGARSESVTMSASSMTLRRLTLKLIHDSSVPSVTRRCKRCKCWRHTAVRSTSSSDDPFSVASVISAVQVNIISLLHHYSALTDTNVYCSVYGLIVKHKEESHAIIMEKESEMCRFCFHKSPRVEHVFNENEKDKKLEHLAIHANFDQLYKCKEPDCGFAADDISLFHDHNFQNHIATVLTDEVSWEFNLPALVQALSQVHARPCHQFVANCKFLSHVM